MLIPASLHDAGNNLIGQRFCFAGKGGPSLIDLGRDIGLCGDDLGVAFFAGLSNGSGLLVEKLLAPGFLFLIDLGAGSAKL